MLIKAYIPKIVELMCEIVWPSIDESTPTTVRGKVVNIVKLNLLKGENGSYFHLEGTITDYTASLDIVFSPQVHSLKH